MIATAGHVEIKVVRLEAVRVTQTDSTKITTFSNP